MSRHFKQEFCILEEDLTPYIENSFVSDGYIPLFNTVKKTPVRISVPVFQIVKVKYL